MKSSNKRVIILPEQRFDWTEKQLKNIARMWNLGLSISDISKNYQVMQLDVILVVAHLDLYGLIKPREGGIFGRECKHRV